MSWLSKTVKKVGKAFTGIPEVITQVGSDLLTNMFNSKAQKEQQAFDLRMWNLQNEYNTPANQIARLRAAGLNPNLFYGQGNVGNATSAPTTEAVRYNFDFAKAFDKMALAEQMKNMREQNKNLQAQNNNLNATTESINLENRLKGIQLQMYEKYGFVPQGAGSGGFWKQIIKYGKDLWDNPSFKEAVKRESPLNHNSNAAKLMLHNSIVESLFNPQGYVKKRFIKTKEHRDYFNYPRR